MHEVLLTRRSGGELRSEKYTLNLFSEAERFAMSYIRQTEESRAVLLRSRENSLNCILLIFFKLVTNWQDKLKVNNFVPDIC